MNVKINKIATSYMKTEPEAAAKHIKHVLLAITIIAVIFSFNQGIEYAIKIILITLTAVIAARETEILYLTHNHSILRSEAKEMIKSTYPEITGLIFALILPIGTPLYIVAIGAFIAIFVGKMVFGGYTFNPFNPAVIGRIFVSLSWPALLTNKLNIGLVNWTLIKVFGTNVDAQTAATPLSDSASIINSLVPSTQITTFDWNTSILGYGINGAIGEVGLIALILGFLYLIIRKSVSIIAPITTIATVFVITLILGLYFDMGIEYSIAHILAGGLLFASFFMLTDPYTTPYTTFSKIIYGVGIGIITVIIRILGNEAEGVIYALLFMNLFVPMLNSNRKKQELGLNKRMIILTISLIIAIGLSTALIIMTLNTATPIAFIGGLV